MADDREMNAEHKEKILKNMKEVAENLKIDKMIPMLFSSGIIDIDDKRELEAKVEGKKRNTYFLSEILMSKPDWAFDAFTRCLKDSMQSHVAAQLTSDPHNTERLSHGVQSTDGNEN